MFELEGEKLTQICRRFGINLLVLFGSRAKGWADAESDFDIGVWIEDYQDDWRREAELWGVLSDVFKAGELDMVVLNRADGALSYEIACYGKPLFESRPFLFQKFQVLAMKRYEDMKKINRWNRQYISDFLKERSHDAQ